METDPWHKFAFWNFQVLWVIIIFPRDINQGSLRSSFALCKFGVISFQDYVSNAITHPVIFGNLDYKLRRVKGAPNLILSGSKIVKGLRRCQYDPAIIDRTTGGLVPGPFTTLYRSFLKNCSLTNKAVRTVWWRCPNLLRGDKVLIFVPSIWL